MGAVAIQKYTMEEKQIAECFGGQICILSGFDMQQTMPYGTPEEVRAEVRFMVDTFYRTDRQLMLTMGNGAQMISVWKAWRRSMMRQSAMNRRYFLTDGERIRKRHLDTLLSIEGLKMIQ